MQTSVPSTIHGSQETHKIDKVIQFVRSCIIGEVEHRPDEFISTIFPVAKRNSEDIRIILNLRSLNTSVTHEHFKMEHFSSALNLVVKDCFMASIDLKDSYYSVNVKHVSRKYLRFYCNNRLNQFTCLAQGLTRN